MDNITDKISSKHLGKKSTGSEFYDPSLLVVVPRFENRKQYNIDNNDLPFVGYDVWHGYEFSCLTEKGVPVTRVIKLKYNCNNEFLIESKSLKLYLNSFNMSRFGKNIEDALIIASGIIKKDLSEKLQTDVEVCFLDFSTPTTQIYSKFIDIMTLVDENKLSIENFKESPDILKVLEADTYEYYLRFDSLRSNCRVTHQPDFGRAFIYYKSKKRIEESSLVEYLTSFRAEYHFHEECCEMIFKRLQDLLGYESEIFVGALYTRRGGIDICPSRWSKNFDCEFVKDLLDISKYSTNGIQF